VEAESAFGLRRGDQSVGGRSVTASRVDHEDENVRSRWLGPHHAAHQDDPEVPIRQPCDDRVKRSPAERHQLFSCVSHSRNRDALKSSRASKRT